MTSPVLQVEASVGLGSGPFAGSGAKAYLFLGLIPVVDSIANQLQNAFGLAMGSLSMLQALRGVLAVVLTFMVLKYFYAICVSDRTALLAALLFIGSLVVYVSKEVIVTGGVAVENVMHYVQILYWLEVWLLAAAFFNAPHRCDFALKCILVATSLSSASIFYGYLSGDWSAYDYQDVTGSVGLFGTGKGVAGQLVAGAIASAYVLRDRAGALGAAAACVMFAAAFLTYARAGQVALAGALCALFLWTVAMCRDMTATRWARRLLAWCVLGGVIGLAVMGTGDLTARWADITDPDQAGSGRIVFWQMAVNYFWDGDFAGLLLGNGYAQMCTSMESGYGLRIHTHNDFLDMLLVGGMLGIVCLLAVWIALIARLRSTGVSRPGYGAGLAILAGFLAQSALTGQIFDPSTMSIYVIAFVCVTGMGAEEETVVSVPLRFRGRLPGWGFDARAGRQ